jgi:O-antigen ligase
MRLWLTIFLLAVTVGSLFFLSPLTVLVAIVGVAVLLVTAFRPLMTLAALAAYLPFEPVILKYTPDEIYLYARFFSEGIIYLLAAVVAWRVLKGTCRARPTPIDLPFVLFLVILLASSLVNAVEPSIAILGSRQILRFILIFYIVVYLKPDRAYVRTLTGIMFLVVGVESLIGLTQSFVGTPMDTFLLPSESHSFGGITLTGGVAQFWDPGSRIFATLGRYDCLGNFLYFFLLIAVGLFYELRNKAGVVGEHVARLLSSRSDLIPLFLLGIPALILTYSRSSWFAFLLGFLFIGAVMKRDRRVVIAFASCAIVAAAYIGVSGLNVRFITEAPGQTLVERFYETFSYARWRGEYYGLGRLFWMVQTPLTVIPASPLFGFGPGQFGGGAVAALGNGSVYEQLGLPYGVYGTEGIIDNNWFSLWGETGTLGLIFFLWIYVAILRQCLRVYRTSRDAHTRAIAIGTMAALLGVALNAFLSTVFEIRTLAFYLWMYAGFVVVFAEENRKGKPYES